MAVTREDLRTEVGASPGGDALLDRCLSVATDLLGTYMVDNLDAAEIDAVPESVHDQALLTAAADLFHQSKAPNGIAMQEYDLGDGGISSTPVRVSRDPLRGARAVLELYVGPAIA